MTDRQTDRQTDGQMDARGKTICLPTLKGGDINIEQKRNVGEYFEGLLAVYIGIAPITQLCAWVIQLVAFKGGHLMW